MPSCAKELRMTQINFIDCLHLASASGTLSLATARRRKPLKPSLWSVSLLGSQWHNAVPLFRWLALHGAFLSIVDAMQPYFFIKRRERMISYCYTAYVIILIPAIVAAAVTSDVEAVATARTIVTFLFLLGMFGVLIHLKVFKFRGVFGMLWLLLLGTAAMVLALLSMSDEFGPLVSLVLGIIVGILTFSSTVVVLWYLSGRPNGAESAISAFASQWLFTGKRRSARDFFY